MKKFYQGEEVIFEQTFYSDKLKQSPVDPSDVDLTLEAPDGSNETPTVTENGSRPTNLGKYIATHTVDKYGVWDWRWETTSPKIVKQGKFEVIRTNID